MYIPALPAVDKVFGDLGACDALVDLGTSNSDETLARERREGHIGVFVRGSIWALKDGKELP